MKTPGRFLPTVWAWREGRMDGASSHLPCVVPQHTALSVHPVMLRFLSCPAWSPHHPSFPDLPSLHFRSTLLPGLPGPTPSSWVCPLPAHPGWILGPSLLPVSSQKRFPRATSALRTHPSVTLEWAWLHRGLDSRTSGLCESHLDS